MNRRFLSLLGVVLVLAGCAPTGETTETVYENPAVIAPYLQGLTKAQAADYVEWFNEAQIGDQLGWSSRPSIVGAEGATGAEVPEKPAFDPTCPLSFAYEFNATAGGAYTSNADPLSDQLEIPETFFSASRQETLFFLSGSKRVGGAGGTNGCADAWSANGREVIYLPVRIRFDTASRPLWIIEGFTNPAATIDIAVDTGPEPLKLTGDLNRIADEVKAVYALPRMRRFAMTSENAGRVLEYSKIGQQSGPARRIIWFRTADLAPYYRHLAKGNCSAAVLAFWDVSARKDGKGSANGGIQGEAEFKNDRRCDSEAVLPAGEEGKTEEDSGKKRGTAWIDPQGRYVAAVKSDGSNRDDDACAEFGCVPVNNDQWDEALDSLYFIASTAGDNRNSDPNRTARNAALNKLYSVLQDAGARDTNRVPASLGGDGGGEGGDGEGGYQIPADVFPVLASGGPEAWNRLQKGYAGGGEALQATIAYTGRADIGEWDPEQSNADPVTITPTFRLVENDALWYDRNSLIFGTGTFLTRSAVFTTGDTDRTGGTVELPVRRSPVARITIKITDTIRQQVNSTYTSNWLPLYAIGDFWATKVDLDTCGAFDILCYIRRAIDWLIETALRNTIGELMGSLSKGTAGNLLAIPSIEPYEISEVYNGQVRYRVYDEIGRYLLFKGGPLESSVEQAIKDNPNIPAKCFQQAAQISDDNLEQWSDCYKPNGMFGLFSTARALMLVLFLFYTARFFLNLMANRQRDMNITSFLARAGISFFLILYIGFLLRMMGLVVAEVILLTNVVGTMVTGESYSHLWLFQTYINPPSGLQGIQAMTDFIGMSFSLLGMLILSIAGWLRLGLTTLVILISPLWIVNIMSARTPEFFYKSLFWIIRLWIIPMITLLLLLLLFLGVKMIDPAGNGPQTGLIGMIAMIIIAIVPWRLSSAVIKKGSERIRSTIQASLEQQSNDGMDRLLQAGLAGGAADGGGGRGGGTLGGGGGSNQNKGLLDQARGKGGKGGKGGGKGSGGGGSEPGSFRMPSSKFARTLVNDAVIRPERCPDCGGKWDKDDTCKKCGKRWTKGSISPKAVAKRAIALVAKGAPKGSDTSTTGIIADAVMKSALARMRDGRADNPGEALTRMKQEGSLSKVSKPELTEAEKNAKRWERQAAKQEETRNKHAYDLKNLRANTPESVRAYGQAAMSWRSEMSAAREARDATARAVAAEMGSSAANYGELRAQLDAERAAAEAELAERRTAAERFNVDPASYTAETQARLNRIAEREERLREVRERHEQAAAARPTRPREAADGSEAWFKEREKARKGMTKAEKKQREAIAERDKWNGYGQAQDPFGPSPRAERAETILDPAPEAGPAPAGEPPSL